MELELTNEEKLAEILTEHQALLKLSLRRTDAIMACLIGLLPNLAAPVRAKVTDALLQVQQQSDPHDPKFGEDPFEHLLKNAR